VDERDRSNVKPCFADEPEPRRTREQAADVVVEGGAQSKSSAEALLKARGGPVPGGPRAEGRQAESRA
jgi:hypothetical protein